MILPLMFSPFISSILLSVFCTFPSYHSYSLTVFLILNILPSIYIPSRMTTKYAAQRTQKTLLCCINAVLVKLMGEI